MRWFKHMTNSHNDEVLSEVMDEFGAEGYGMFWLILEKIGQSMDKTDRCFSRYSVKVWANSCRVSAKKFQTFVRFLEIRNVFSLKFENNYLTIECANLLKYRDEYTKKDTNKVKETPDKLQSDAGQTPSQDTEAEAETDINNIVVINARENEEFNESEKAKAVPSSESDLLIEWKVYWQSRGFTNVKYITDPNINRLCLMLVREGLTKPEVDAVIAEIHEISKPQSVSTPLYYERPIMAYVEAKKNPKPVNTDFGQTTTRGSNYAANKRALQERRAKIDRELEEDYERALSNADS